MLLWSQWLCSMQIAQWVFPSGLYRWMHVSCLQIAELFITALTGVPSWMELYKRLRVNKPHLKNLLWLCTNRLFGSLTVPLPLQSICFCSEMLRVRLRQHTGRWRADLHLQVYSQPAGVRTGVEPGQSHSPEASAARDVPLQPATYGGNNPVTLITLAQAEVPARPQ